MPISKDRPSEANVTQPTGEILFNGADFPAAPNAWGITTAAVFRHKPAKPPCVMLPFDEDEPGKSLDLLIFAVRQSHEIEDLAALSAALAAQVGPTVFQFRIRPEQTAPEGSPEGAFRICDGDGPIVQVVAVDPERMADFYPVDPVVPDDSTPELSRQRENRVWPDLLRRLAAPRSDEEIREWFYTGLPETALSQPTPDAAQMTAAGLFPHVADAPPSNSEAAFIIGQVLLMLPQDGPEQLFVMAAAVAAYEQWTARADQEA